MCLQRYSQLDKAVVSSCLHSFCVSCLAAWTAKKRSCPVCRAAVSSFLHSIASDVDYQEFTCHSPPPAVHEQQQQQLSRSESHGHLSSGSGSSSQAASRIQLRTTSVTSW